ncbi:hypothetical protein AURDEDRAFT_187844 [Auricularia subglabra TFB-10046 SS5]|nr:hypothetical protein AURDEDRAFT_187844 [Auricularia subglabra TFB-10046 SS5]
MATMIGRGGGAGSSLRASKATARLGCVWSAPPFLAVSSSNPWAAEMNATVTMTPAKMALIMRGVANLRLTRYLDISATTALLYDFADTFGREQRLFWHGPWSWLRFLFFLNRYSAIFVQLFNTSSLMSSPSKEVRKFAIGFLLWTGVGEIFIVQAILCIRLNAMYDRQRTIVHSLLALFISTCTGTIATLAYQVARLHVSGKVTNSPPSSEVTACFVPVKVQDFALVSVPILTFDLVAVLLAMYKAYYHMTTKIAVNVSLKENVHVSAHVQPAWTGPRLLRVLIRDSMIYFIIICSVYILNILIWRLEETSLSLVATGWSLTLLSVAGSRMLLNLREAREGDAEHQLPLPVAPENFEFNDLHLSLRSPGLAYHQPETSETALLSSLSPRPSM